MKVEGCSPHCLCFCHSSLAWSWVIISIFDRFLLCFNEKFSLITVVGSVKEVQGFQGTSSSSCNGCQTLRLDAILEDLDQIKSELGSQENASLGAIRALKDDIEILQKSTTAQDQELRNDVEILKRAAILKEQWQPCDCNLMGSYNDTCDPDTKRCPCYDKYMGRLCNDCKNGFYNFPKCDNCGCNVVGTYGAVCDKTNGECFCKDMFKGAKCDECKNPFVTGENCERCLDNYYGYPECKGWQF